MGVRYRAIVALGSWVFAVSGCGESQRHSDAKGGSGGSDTNPSRSGGAVSTGGAGGGGQSGGNDAGSPGASGGSTSGGSGGVSAGAKPGSSGGSPSTSGGTPSVEGGGGNGSPSGGAEEGGSGGAEPTTDREWAAWPMPNPASAALPNPARYDTTTEPTIVHDLVTGLSWPRALSPGFHEQRDAMASCEALSLGGHDDFRLPTLIEYLSILDWTHTVPAIDETIFPDPGDYADNLFWTATPNVSDPQHGAWVADFAFLNSVSTHPINDRFPVRCVRGGGAAGPVHYRLTDDTVFDLWTSLTWERHVGTEQYSAADAAAHCEALELDGKSDWRLPGLGELYTLVNVRTSSIPMMDREAFPDEEGTANIEFRAAAPWSVKFWGAEIHRRAASDLLRVRCVR